MECGRQVEGPDLAVVHQKREGNASRSRTFARAGSCIRLFDNGERVGHSRRTVCHRHPGRTTDANDNDERLRYAYIPRIRVTVATRLIATMYAAVRMSTLYFSEVCNTALNASHILASRRSLTSFSVQK